MTELRWYQDANLRTNGCSLGITYLSTGNIPEFGPGEVDRVYLTEWEDVPTVYEEQP